MPTPESFSNTFCGRLELDSTVLSVSDHMKAEFILNLVLITLICRQYFKLNQVDNEKKQKF